MDRNRLASLATMSVATLLVAGSAFAGQNVADTNQKGSLLIWPLITVDGGADTFIEISNDSAKGVHVECYYVNEKKGRVDFDFNLTGKQTASWSVRTLAGDKVQPPIFPTSGDFTGGRGFPRPNPNRGELICFATKGDRTAQVAFNHLTGHATVADSTGSFRYNAWSFKARNEAGGPEGDRVVQGTPGRLELTGGGAGTYDACPAYNIANFMPNGATLGGLTTTRNVLTVVSCNQDLRQDYKLHLTKLQFTVWNANEHSFTGAFICVDSVNSVELGDGNPDLENGSNFDQTVLRTRNARFQVAGVKSTQCSRRTEASGLLGVLASDTNLGTVGDTTHTAGSAPGFVLWDPAGTVQPRE